MPNMRIKRPNAKTLLKRRKVAKYLQKQSYNVAMALHHLCCSWLSVCTQNQLEAQRRVFRHKQVFATFSFGNIFFLSFKEFHLYPECIQTTAWQSIFFVIILGLGERYIDFNINPQH